VKLPPNTTIEGTSSINVGGVITEKKIYKNLYEILSFPTDLKVNNIAIRHKDGVVSNSYSSSFNQILSTFKFIN